jgi:hypothetical protein
LLVCQAVYQEKATVKELAWSAPRHIAEWHLRPLLTAKSWNARMLLGWFADQVIAILLPPEDGLCYVVSDGTLQDKTGAQHPLAKKGRLNEYAPYVFGLHLVVMMLPWGNYRMPMDFAIVRRRDAPNYQSENALFHQGVVAVPVWVRDAPDYRLKNALFRQMLVRLRRPLWAEMLVVVADAGLSLQGAHPADPPPRLLLRDRLCTDVAFRERARFEGSHHPFAKEALLPVLGTPQ